MNLQEETTPQKTINETPEPIKQTKKDKKTHESKENKRGWLEFIRIADRVLRFTGHLAIFLVIVWILMAFRRVYNDNAYTFAPFSVPPSLTDKGYSGDVVVAKIASEIQDILARRYYDEQNPEAYRQITAQQDFSFSAENKIGFIDIQSLFSLGKILLGKKDKIIKGYITLDSNVISLAIQVPDIQAHKINLNRKMPIDSVIHQAAIYLIRQTTPQYLVYYYLNKHAFDETEKLLQEIDFKLSSTNQTHKSPTYDYDRIQWYMSWTNLLLAKKEYAKALQKAEELKTAYPNDLASYSQIVNILNAEVIELENQRTDTVRYLSLARQAMELAQAIAQKDLNSVFLDKKMAKGWLYANWAYMQQKCDIDSPEVLPKYLKAIELLPHSATPYNMLSYYYMDKYNYNEAEKCIQKALLADPRDGNSWDTYAEIMAIKNDTTRFLQYIEKALQNSNPTQGITAEYYSEDARWINFRKMADFQNLLKKYN
jgi:tetratricopeptide (TPR) repeat protein